MDKFENAGYAGVLVWTAKTELFENVYVTAAIIISVAIFSKMIIYVDRKHFIHFSDKNAVFKFIRLRVDGRPIRRKSCVFKFVQLCVDIALERDRERDTVDS